DRVAAVREDDRNASGGCFSRLRHGATTSAVNHGHVAADKIGRQRQQKIALLAAPAVIDLDVLSFDIARFAKALAKCCQRAGLRGGSALGEKANHPDGRLLPPRALHLHCEQQTAAADQGNELTPRRVEHGLPSRNPLCQLTACSGCPGSTRRSLG